MSGEAMPIEAVELMATIMQSNADQQSWIFEQLMGAYEKDRTAMSEAFAALYDALADIPDYARTVTIDNLLFDHQSDRSIATLWGAPHHSNGGDA